MQKTLMEMLIEAGYPKEEMYLESLANNPNIVNAILLDDEIEKQDIRK